MPQCSTGFLKIVSTVIAVFSFLLNFSFLLSKMLANFSYHSEKFAKLRNTPSINSYFKSSEYNDHPKYSRKSLPTSLDWPIELQQKHFLEIQYFWVSHYARPALKHKQHLEVFLFKKLDLQICFCFVFALSGLEVPLLGLGLCISHLCDLFFIFIFVTINHIMSLK